MRTTWTIARRQLERGTPTALTMTLLVGVVGVTLGSAVRAQPADAAAHRASSAASHPRSRTAVDSLPFYVGERFGYRMRVARFGEVGRGAMWVEGPAEVRGTPTYRLRFDFDTKVGLVRVVNRTESWLDPVQLRALRFHKHERHPLSKHDQRVELYPDEGRWEDAVGGSGTIATASPLDELSYLYFIRTLPLAPDSTYRFDRHFEAERNPTTVRVVGREQVTTPIGTFHTVLVEMRVKDARRYGREGVLRINLTDDHCRLPVQIRSQVPVVGAAVLTLESHTHPTTHFAPAPP